MSEGDFDGILLKEFTVRGLLGQNNYKMSIKPPATIIVGPNGTGKSNFLSIFYLVITKQWAKLTDYDFDEVVLKSDLSSLSIFRRDLFNFTEILSESSRTRDAYETLTYLNKLGVFLSCDLSNVAERRYYSDLLKMPAFSVEGVQKKVRDIIHSNNLYAVAGQFIDNLNLGPVIYMPTYRRIERSFEKIFPENYRRKIDPSGDDETPIQSGRRYLEVFGSGMNDVKSMIRDEIQSVALRKQEATTKISQEYIADIVKGNIKEFSLERLRHIDDVALIEFIEGLSDEIFSARERETLKKKIISLGKRRVKGRPNSEDQYFGLYVEKLIKAQQFSKSFEEPLSRLSELANKYIGPRKRFNFLSSSNFHSADHTADDGYDIDGLSSGEKQLLATFTYLLLSGISKSIFIIDEPELSLSVPWQKTFLPDILVSGGCQHIFAVTHSPFIFDNRLRENLIDTQGMAENAK